MRPARTIVEARLKGKALMNDNSEIYGPCRHISKFHRFPSTDERSSEKGKIDRHVTVRKKLKGGSNKGKGRKKRNSGRYRSKRFSATATRFSL